MKHIHSNMIYHLLRHMHVQLYHRLDKILLYVISGWVRLPKQHFDGEYNSRKRSHGHGSWGNIRPLCQNLPPSKRKAFKKARNQSTSENPRPCFQRNVQVWGNFTIQSSLMCWWSLNMTLSTNVPFVCLYILLYILYIISMVLLPKSNAQYTIMLMCKALGKQWTFFYMINFACYLVNIS